MSNGHPHAPRILTLDQQRKFDEIAQRQKTSRLILSRYMKAAGYDGATEVDCMAVLAFRLHELERNVAALANAAGIGDGTLPPDLYPEMRDSADIVIARPDDVPTPPRNG